MAVLTGGSTPERDVALAGAAEVVSALRNSGHTVSVVDTVSGPLSPDMEAALLTGTVSRDPPTPDELRELRQRELGPAMVELPELRDADVVFPVLHGKQGEGGELQALLELAQIPFTGSDALGSAIAMAKDVAKAVLRNAGLLTPDWAVWPVSPEQVTGLGLPLVVKPSRVGSTIGLSIIDSLDQLADAVELAREYDDDVILEAFIRGRELTVGILGDAALAVGEIIPDHAYFDYECKYTPGLTQEIFPADLDGATTAALQAMALTAHRVLKLRDFSRIDFIQTSGGEAFCLEANTLPGLTRTSLLPQSADAAGIAFPELLTRMCVLAADRHHGTKAAK